MHPKQIIAEMNNLSATNNQEALAHIENLERNLKHMHDYLDVTNLRENRLVDFVNHMETILRELKNTLEN